MPPIDMANFSRHVKKEMWQVMITRKATKQLVRLLSNIQVIFDRLAKELKVEEPAQPNWSYYGKLKGSSARYHCLIKDWTTLLCCMLGSKG